MKGQGATEYLVLLAVVLIIALVSIALLGFFPGLVPDARITQSSAYWQSARPFAILESAVSGQTMTIVLRNNEGSGTLTLTNVTIGTTGVNIGSNTTSLSFSPGEQKTLTMSMSANGTVGTVYDMPVVLKYNTSNSISNVQYGTKNIVGKYS